MSSKQLYILNKNYNNTLVSREVRHWGKEKSTRKFAGAVMIFVDRRLVLTVH